MGHDTSGISALSRLFSASVLREFCRFGRSSLFARLVEQSQIPLRIPLESTVGATFDAAFGVLKKTGLRDEYVYRTALTEKILLGRHSLKSATMLTEVRAGTCKADVVVLNGTSTAYEIKSERDSLARLQNQLSNYRKVFATVNVVVSPLHLHDVLAEVPDDVGVISLSDRFTLQTVRTAQNLPERTSPAMIFELLRVDEALTLLKTLGINPPNVPNTRIRSELGKIFASLDSTVVHSGMVRTLRESRSQAGLTGFIGSLPSSLKAATLAAKPDAKSRIHIKAAVETPLVEALAWK